MAGDKEFDRWDSVTLISSQPFGSVEPSYAKNAFLIAISASVTSDDMSI